MTRASVYIGLDSGEMSCGKFCSSECVEVIGATSHSVGKPYLKPDPLRLHLNHSLHDTVRYCPTEHAS